MNEQPQQGQELHPLGHLRVHSIFHTIQGEGPFVGRPAAFIRLAGCNLACPGCDTDYTRGPSPLIPAATIITRLQRPSLVVITGGEPFRQNITELVNRLLGTCDIQIETNGTLSVPGFPWNEVTVVCSPKTPKLHPALKVDAYKYVLDSMHIGEDGLPTAVLGYDKPPARPPKNFPKDRIYLQPLDEFGRGDQGRNTQAAINSCLKHGYRLCLQIHKSVGLQ